MEPIQVRPYPITKSFKSMEAAVASAKSHPRQPDARRDSQRLAGATFIDACWSPYGCIMRFDCQLNLGVRIEETEICWSVLESTDTQASGEFERVGAPPVMLDWGGAIGLSEMDCSSMIAKRRGAQFKMLFVGDVGLWVYLHSHLILRFAAVERVSDRRSILFVCEDD
jgi:hypothetical protein